jgi:putative Mn2+ efflux pump MntP
LLGLSIALTVIWIGVQAFLAAQVGLRFGSRLGEEARERSEQVAGVALIAVAIILLLLKLAKL